MIDVSAILSGGGFSACLWGYSAIDSYLRRNAGAAVRVLTNAGAVDLARLFEELRYPGVEIADAALGIAGGSSTTIYFSCCDSAETRGDFRPSFQFLEFYRDESTRRFHDPRGIYPLLRAMSGKPLDNSAEPDRWHENLNPGAERCPALADAALILAHYFPQTSSRKIQEIAGFLRNVPEGPPPGAEAQRLLLAELLASQNPAPGFELLKNAGFTDAYWPELAVLDNVDHAKEFHPEGNVWRHTLETLRYRKTGNDLRLSLGLLLHDIGKPLAASAGSRRFNGHAELGARAARRFLERLGFDASLIADVCFLVKNHMLPAALPRLPLVRTGEVMASPLFPALLELYRCDESSSFKGLDGYYESAAAYQSYLKNRRNPYRSADGKKLKRQYAGAVTSVVQ